ncbi:MAG: T9SS type A sorting domain-containing protein [Salinivirgaceae bacterium]|jgi:photosystem II stability/assembly factor-like uncharacterized protein|nr:T9SS type A sorting domain-containing protein [Bacteroidales bacterium]
MKTLTLITTLLLICLQTVAQDFWVPLDTPENFWVRAMTSNSHGVYFGLKDGVYRTLDNGKTIEKTGLNSAVRSFTVDANDRIYAGSWNLHSSDNNGDTWDTIPTPEVPCAIHVNEKFIVFSNGGRIYKKNLHDTVWTIVFEDYYDSPITSFTQNNEGALFAGTINFFANSDILFSFDSGNTWESCWQDDNHVQSLATNSIDYIFAGTRFGFFRSTNNGNTWERKKLADVQAIIIDSNDRIFIGCTDEYGGPGCVLYSDDHGDTWEDITQGLTNLRIEKMALSSDGYLLLVVGCSSNVSSLFRTITPVSTNIQNIVKHEQLLIFPNPVNNMLTYSTKQPLEGKNALIKIYNINGEKTLEKEIQLSSNNSLDISYLKTGTYIFHLQLNSQILTKKIIKL